MVVNLTLNPSEHFGNDDVIDFKRDEIFKLLAEELWTDAVADCLLLSKKLAAFALESGAKSAVIDVPAYAVSILETELMLRDIIPLHYYSGIFVEARTDILLENLYDILEKQTAAHEEQQQKQSQNTKEDIEVSAELTHFDNETVLGVNDEVETAELTYVEVPAIVVEAKVEGPVREHKVNPFQIKINTNFKGNL